MPPGEYVVHSRFVRCVNFVDRRDGGSLVALVDPVVGNGPFNIVVEGGLSDPGDVLRVDARAVTIGAMAWSLDGVARYASTPALPVPLPRDRLVANLRVLEERLRRPSPVPALGFLLAAGEAPPASGAFERGFRERCHRGVSLLRRGDLAAGAKTLRGAGYGLTPSGDDFLCGFLVAARVAQAVDGRDRSRERETLLASALGGNLLSNAFLTAACQGWLHEPLKNLVQALAGADEAALRRAIEPALARGETSGADLAVGLAIGVDHWD